MLQVVNGRTEHEGPAKALVEELEGAGLEQSTLYIGYPMVETGDEIRNVDALLVGPERGVVVFDLSLGDSGQAAQPEFWESVEDTHFEIVASLRSKLTANPKLLDKATQSLPFSVRVVSYVPRKFPPPQGRDVLVAQRGSLAGVLAALTQLPAEVARRVNSTIQGLSRIRGRRSGPAQKGTRKHTLNSITREIAELDRWQLDAAIRAWDGPQRIRGIAGSGKTVVLALKAAYLHASDPNLRIALTFYTRALHQHITTLVRTFFFDLVQREPDWGRLRVLHSWGTASRTGVYRLIADEYEIETLPFSIVPCSPSGA